VFRAFTGKRGPIKGIKEKGRALHAAHVPLKSKGEVQEGFKPSCILKFCLPPQTGETESLLQKEKQIALKGAQNQK